MNNNSQLYEIMNDNKLSRNDVTRMCHSKRSTIDRWMVSESVDKNGEILPNPTYNRMPDSKLALLLMSLERLHNGSH